MRLKHRLLSTGMVVLLLFFFSCLDQEEDEQDTTIHLDIVQVGTFSMVLKVSVEDISYPWYFSVTRDDSVAVTAFMHKSDTTFTDRSLSPGHSYYYRAYWLEDGVPVDSSAEVVATTRDTTSHNFIWEFDTLGNYGSVVLDVEIVDENRIWGVGEFYTGHRRVDAIYWNGIEWNWELIGLQGVVGDGLYWFDENNIWVATGTVFHWNGTEWERYQLWDMGVIDEDDGGVKKVWGVSPDNIYFVGGKGVIVHYNGSTFTKMESGTDTEIIDIYGLDATHIWATAYDNTVDEDHPEGYESVTLFCDGTEWTKMYVHPQYYWPDVTDSISGGMTSVWAYEDTVYICSAAGIWAKPVNGGPGVIHRPEFVEWAFLKQIRGNNYNDIFITTRFGQVYHYNGSSWQKIESYSDEHPDGRLTAYGGLDVKNDMVVVAGDYYNFFKAYIMRGYRQ